MKIIALESVIDFLNSLEASVQADIRRLIALLEDEGHMLSMPYAKPIGQGLWELRRTGRPQIRLVYGFCKGNAILLVAFKKQRSTLPAKDILLARKLFTTYCR